MKRLLDILLAIIGLVVLGIPLLVVALLVRLTSPGPVLYWSDRVGKGNRLFRMPKFRTMRVGTPVAATHVLADPGRYLTPGGGFLRKTSLDELPQIFTILKGEMSIVGPRPALFNQEDLIALRTEKGVHEITPGLTGWAQVNGWRGNTSLEKRIEYDLYYIGNWSLRLDLKIMWLTLIKGLFKHAY